MLVLAFIKEMLRPISQHTKYAIQICKWKVKNRHNQVEPLNLCDISKIKVGTGSYGKIDVHTFNNKDELLVIGNYCSITNGCAFILSGEHNYKRPMTYPVRNLFSNSLASDADCKGPIVMQDDVWIGFGCTILSGVTIGQGAIIGAGTVVSKDIPPYSIAVGNPAKIVKYRFDSPIVELLKSVNWEHFQFDSELEKYFTEEVTLDSIEEILRKQQSIEEGRK